LTFGLALMASMFAFRPELCPWCRPRWTRCAMLCERISCRARSRSPKRFLYDLLKQLGRFSGVPATLMPATGLVEHQQFGGPCISSMPISSHCFWPWLNVSGQPVQDGPGEEKPCRQFRAHVSTTLTGALPRTAHRSHPARALDRKIFEIFKDRQILINRRRFEICGPMPRLDDLILFQPGNFMILEFDRAAHQPLCGRR